MVKIKTTHQEYHSALDKYTPGGYTADMEKITNRLHRVCGQVVSIEPRILAGESCEDIIPQLLAIKGSVDSCVRAYMEEALDSCVADNEPEKMKKIIKAMVKNI